MAPSNWFSLTSSACLIALTVTSLTSLFFIAQSPCTASRSTPTQFQPVRPDNTGIMTPLGVILTLRKVFLDFPLGTGESAEFCSFHSSERHSLPDDNNWNGRMRDCVSRYRAHTGCFSFQLYSHLERKQVPTTYSSTKGL